MSELSNLLTCRLCLQKQFQLLPMFPANEPVNDDLLRKIYECASVRISYEYDQSSAICIKCIVDVEQFYTFKQRCIESDILFQKLRQDCGEKGMEEGEFDGVPLPETDFMEPITNLESPRQDASRAIESFIGPSTLVQIGYNYRVVRVNDEVDVLVYRKHRFYQPEPKTTESNKWICVANTSNNCPARISVLSSHGMPLALFSNPVRHNHCESIVQMIGTVESGSEEIVHAEAEYTLAVDSNQRLRLLAGGYRYRLRQAIFGAGKSLWNCVRVECPAVIQLSHRYYGRTAYVNGSIEWHCVRGVSTYCEATVTIDKCGEIVAEHSVHDHERSRKRDSRRQRTAGSHGPKPSTHDIFNSPGPVRLLAGGFNYRRMHNDHLNIDIIIHVAHKYLSGGSDTKSYHCILRDEPGACPGKIILTNNALSAEIVTGHNHLARTVPKLAEPDRTAQVIVEGPNYELIYSMTGRNCLILHEGHVFRMYKMLEPTQTSRWRCVHGEVGCKAFLSVPLTLTKPAVLDDHPHDHSRVKHDSTANLVKVKEEIVEDGGTFDCIKQEDSPRLRLRAVREAKPAEDVKGTIALINPSTSDPQSHELTLSMFQDIRGTLIKEEMKREMLQIKPDPDAMTCFLNGHLYVRHFEGLESLDTPEWLCAFHWTLGCNARLSDLSVHTHERFATVRTNDRFNMLKNLISQGMIGQRGTISQMPDRQKVSEYELLPSNGNLSLIIDENRYYFYKAKNNGEWLWRCVRYRWQGCKIGVAVSHCFGKYYYQPYGKTEHVHTS
uniref:ZAD domain-containing protein n=1 Tax=Anopheles epiroticus TaxID=199890 RepID=A0A182PNI7_9DIPT